MGEGVTVSSIVISHINASIISKWNILSDVENIIMMQGRVNIYLALWKEDPCRRNPLISVM